MVHSSVQADVFLLCALGGEVDTVLYSETSNGCRALGRLAQTKTMQQRPSFNLFPLHNADCLHIIIA